MELDPITKWLVRISSSILIFLGLILVIAIPLLALKASSAISLTKETIQSDFKDILTGLIEKL
jgi:cytochrome c biogenesis protein CcdA